MNYIISSCSFIQTHKRTHVVLYITQSLTLVTFCEMSSICFAVIICIIIYPATSHFLLIPVYMYISTSIPPHHTCGTGTDLVYSWVAICVTILF